MYHVTFYAHVTISIVTLLSGVSAILLAIINRKRKNTYSRTNRILNQSFVVSMYTQLILGLIMYINPWHDSLTIESTAIQPGGSPQIRFWEIEHVAIMVFALFLVQIGYIFIAKTRSPDKKYVLTFWYFGLSLSLMIFTMIMALR